MKKYENEFEEIGDIGWFNYIETYELIRDYHFDRKKIITKIFNNIALSIDNIAKVKNELFLENWNFIYYNIMINKNGLHWYNPSMPRGKKNNKNI